MTAQSQSQNQTQKLNLSFIAADLLNTTHAYFDLGPRRDTLNIVIPVTIIYSLIFVSGVIGNISTCIVIKKNRSMHTATNYYLFSLAISDFLLLISGVPLEVYFIWSKYPYIFGEYFCIGRGLLAETSANATVLTITAFTVERYIAICHPFMGQAMSKLNRAMRIIILIWLVSLLTAIPQAAQFGIDNYAGFDKCVVVRVIIEHSFQLSTYLFFFVPMSIIMVLYILIGCRLYHSSMIGTSVEQSKPSENDTQNGNGYGNQIGTSEPVRLKMKKLPKDTILNRHAGGNQLSSVRGRINQYGTRRVLKMLVAVVICFFICWAPFHAQRLWAIYGSQVYSNDSSEMNAFSNQEIIYTIMTYISGVLYYLSTCINPLLYNMMSNKFREAFKAMLFGKKSRGSINARFTMESRRFRRTTTMSTATQRESFDSELHAKNSLLQTPFNERC